MPTKSNSATKPKQKWFFPLQDKIQNALNGYDNKSLIYQTVYNDTVIEKYFATKEGSHYILLFEMSKGSGLVFMYSNPTTI